MKEETKFRIWKFKKHKLERIKRACDFNLFINKKDENSYWKNKLNIFLKLIFRLAIIAPILFIFIYIEKGIYEIIPWLQDCVNIKNDIFFQILIATLGLARFLIALFYSNLSGVFSSKYANLDFSIAKAVIEEPENRKSLSGITNYVIINVLLLALSVFSMEYRGIMACCFLMYTLYIIVAFMHISKRIFVFNNLNSITCLEIKKIQVSYSCQDIDNIYWQYIGGLIKLWRKQQSQKKKYLWKKLCGNRRINFVGRWSWRNINTLC